MRSCIACNRSLFPGYHHQTCIKCVPCWLEACEECKKVKPLYDKIAELELRLELAEAVANAYVKYDIFLDHAYDGGDEDDRAEASRIFHEELTPALIAYANQRKI